MITKLLKCTMSAMMVAALGSCGGDGSAGASCGEFAACGGDVVGAWSMNSFCGSGKTALPQCTDPVSYDLAGVTATGDQTFNADKTYSSNTQLSGTATLHVPSTCLMFNGVTLSCEFVPVAFAMGTMGMPDNTIQSLTCSTESAGCSCRLSLKPQTLAQTGTYATNGNSLVITPSTGTASTSDYCVSGTNLKYKPSSEMMAAGTNPGALATVVLTKK